MKTIKYYLLVIVVILITIIICLYSRQNNNNECKTTNSFSLCSFHYDEVDGSKLYLIDKNMSILDSTTVHVKKINDKSKESFVCLTQKDFSVEHDWKLVLNKKFNDKTHYQVIITDIEMEKGNERNMFGSIEICKIYKWKINGIEYSTLSGEEFISSKCTNYIKN